MTTLLPPLCFVLLYQSLLCRDTHKFPKVKEIFRVISAFRTGGSLSEVWVLRFPITTKMFPPFPLEQNGFSVPVSVYSLAQDTGSLGKK